MSDIIDRLRPSYIDIIAVYKLLAEAADEIVRLREQLKTQEQDAIVDIIKLRGQLEKEKQELMDEANNMLQDGYHEAYGEIEGLRQKLTAEREKVEKLELQAAAKEDDPGMS